MFARLEFLLLLLAKHKKEYIWIFIIATTLITLLASVLFIKSSLEYEHKQLLNAQNDITIERYSGGRVQNMPESWLDEYLEIDGVSAATSRVYGEYYFEQKGEHFFIIGIDFYDDASVKLLGKIASNIDIDKFLSKNYMLIGSGVKKFFDKLEYREFYTFRPPDRSKERVYIYGELDKDTQLFSNDVIIMNKELAKKVLGMQDDEVSDIVLDVANYDELQTIINKLSIMHFDTRVISKRERDTLTKELFDYKGGFFLSLYIITLLSFLLIVYQRYSTIKTSERKEIAILRSLGWSIEQVLWMKIVQNFLIIFVAYLVGVIVAYGYVFMMGAPLLQNIFLGGANLPNDLHLPVIIDGGSLMLLFLFFVVPYLLSIIIPLWREVSKEINEVLR